MTTKTKSKPAKITPPPTGGGFMDTPWIWVAGLILLAGAVAITIAAAQGWGDGKIPDSAQSAEVEVVGTPLPEFTTPDPAIGTPAPTFTAQRFDGDTVDIGGDGIARVYGFFAHWCPHCQAELPRLTSYLSTNDLPAGVEVVAISTAVDPTGGNYPPSDWFDREGWPAELVVDDETGTLARTFGLTGFPYWVGVDEEGAVVARISGELTPEQFTALVNQAAG